MPTLIGTRQVPILGKGPSSLLTSLVAYWKLEEASGTRVDATSRGNDLTDVNTVGQAAGKVGNAASFVAANSERLTILDNADLSLNATSFTIGFWVKFTTLYDAEFLLAKGAWNSVANQEYGISHDLGVITGMLRYDNTHAIYLNLTALGEPTVNTWYYLMMWYDLATSKAYLSVGNGTPESGDLVGGARNGAGTFFLGDEGRLGSLLNGALDEVGIWKRILTATERTALYNSGNGITHPFVGT